MTIKTLGSVLAASVIFFCTSSAPGRLPQGSVSSTACLSEWVLAENEQNRMLTSGELALVSRCLGAKLLVLRKNAEALRSGDGLIQNEFPPTAYAKGTVAAAHELVAKYRQGTPDAGWYKDFWQQHQQAAILASEFLFSGDAEAVRNAAVAAGSPEVAGQCSRLCRYGALIRGEPDAPTDKVNHLFDASSKMADMAGVRLGELPASTRDLAYRQMAGVWPTDPAARYRHGGKLFAVFLALRAVGDDRHAQLDFTSAVKQVRQRVDHIRASMVLKAGQRDLRFTREGFLIQELIQMGKL